MLFRQLLTPTSRPHSPERPRLAVEELSRRIMLSGTGTTDPDPVVVVDPIKPPADTNGG